MSLLRAPLLLVATALPAQGLGGSEGPDLTRYFAVCAGLLVLVAALTFGFRRLVGRALKARAAQRSLQVIDLLPLTGKHKLAVVRCYDRTFLIGLGEKELAPITELDGVIAPSNAPAPSQVDLQAFSRALERERSRPAVVPEGGEGVLA